MRVLGANKYTQEFSTKVLDTKELSNNLSNCKELCNETEVHLAVVEVNTINSENSTYFSHVEQLCNNDRGAFLTARNAQAAVIHAITACIPFYKESIIDVMLHTGGSKGSSGSNKQYLAYCSMMRRQPKIDEQRAATVKFGNGTVIYLGMATIDILIEILWLSFGMHVVQADVPILVGMEEMDIMGVYLNNLQKKACEPLFRYHSSY